MTIAVRPADESDMDFVTTTWLDSYRLAHAAGLIAMERWYDVMRPELEAILQRPGCQTLVAFCPGELERGADLYGWIALERGYSEPITRRIRERGRTRKVREWAWRDVPVIHYVFVKKPYREMGVAKALVRAAFVDLGMPYRYTCKTPILTELKVPPRWFDPLIARFGPTEKEHGKDSSKD